MIHEERQLCHIVHGYDFVSVGDCEYLHLLQKAFGTRFGITAVAVGSGEGYAKGAKTSNGIRTALERGYAYESYARR